MSLWMIFLFNFFWFAFGFVTYRLWHGRQPRKYTNVTDMSNWAFEAFEAKQTQIMKATKPLTPPEDIFGTTILELIAWAEKRALPPEPPLPVPDPSVRGQQLVSNARPPSRPSAPPPPPSPSSERSPKGEIERYIQGVEFTPRPLPAPLPDDTAAYLRGMTVEEYRAMKLRERTAIELHMDLADELSDVEMRIDACTSRIRNTLWGPDGKLRRRAIANDRIELLSLRSSIRERMARLVQDPPR